ncbi:hypothetical protein [Salinigranum marinum]|uniref:hypothetical protein n=1 Tax=Salinigranum marinum TaxID=1515595 RepID=UPI002989E72C|nr:hypothetical protein [Salinigranum marinum]
MSYWGVHIGVAGITTALVLFLLAPTLPARRLVIAVSGFWAVIPDFHHVMDPVPAIQSAWLAILHDSALANVFWFHRVIDRADPGDRVVYSMTMWAALLVVLAATELAIRRQRRVLTQE